MTDKLFLAVVVIFVLLAVLIPCALHPCSPSLRRVAFENTILIAFVIAAGLSLLAGILWAGMNHLGYAALISLAGVAMFGLSVAIPALVVFSLVSRLLELLVVSETPVRAGLDA